MKNNQIKRRKPAQARSQQLVKDIVEATAQVLEEVGCEALSTNKVAKRAGVSIGSIYQYFTDKEALIEVLLEERYEQLSRTVIAKLVDIMEQPYAVAAKTCIEMYVEFLASQPELTKLMQDRLSTGVDDNSDLLSGINIDEERGLQLIRTYLLRHQASLAMPDLDAAVYFSYSVALTMGRNIALKPKHERCKYVDELVRMLSLYVGAEFSV